MDSLRDEARYESTLWSVLRVDGRQKGEDTWSWSSESRIVSVSGVNHPKQQTVQDGWRRWRRLSEVMCDRRIAAGVKRRVYKMPVRPAVVFGLETGGRAGDDFVWEKPGWTRLEMSTSAAWLWIQQLFCRQKSLLAFLDSPIRPALYNPTSFKRLVSGALHSPTHQRASVMRSAKYCGMNCGHLGHVQFTFFQISTSHFKKKNPM